MYQNLVSNVPTPVILKNESFSQFGSTLDSVSFNISTTPSFGVFNFKNVFFSLGYDGVFVQSQKLGRTVFGAKYSISCDSSLTPLWCVIDMATTSGSGSTGSLTGVTFYPFSASTTGSGSDTLTIDTNPVDKSHSIYVGVVFLANTTSRVEASGCVSISQYVDQKAFFQPMKG